ncbi:hypothetical protein E2C01_001099 [Portunus trituberculatus]|uniref:Uncharacterized protein n=1 Tax=Portunus trituberculatus TaxID=210409 RepID=A0A5B7CFV4_PORTR|nr:hypothetical protein [Portunus trituberculatus]
MQEPGGNWKLYHDLLLSIAAPVHRLKEGCVWECGVWAVLVANGELTYMEETRGGCGGGGGGGDGIMVQEVYICALMLGVVVVVVECEGKAGLE